MDLFESNHERDGRSHEDQDRDELTGTQNVIDDESTNDVTTEDFDDAPNDRIGHEVNEYDLAVECLPLENLPNAKKQDEERRSFINLGRVQMDSME